jgi:hypothetical protein
VTTTANVRWHGNAALIAVVNVVTAGRAKRNGHDASRLRGAAPEAAPAQAGRAEGPGGPPCRKRPSVFRRPSAGAWWGRSPARRSPVGARDTRRIGRAASPSRAAVRPSLVARCVDTEQLGRSRLRRVSRAARGEDGRQPTGGTALAVSSDEADASSIGAVCKPHRYDPRPA